MNSTEKLGIEAVKAYLKDRGFTRIEKSKARDHDLDTWKNGIKHLIELRARTGTRTAPSMTLSINEFNLLKNNGSNALLIMVSLDQTNEHGM